MSMLSSISVIILLVILSVAICWPTNLPSQNNFRCYRVARGHNRGLMQISMPKKEAEHDISNSKDSSSQFRLLGICGGIGSGKSTACKILVSELNCLALIDSDSIAVTMYGKGSEALNNIVKEFGSDILDNVTGEIDRKKLGAIVFSNRQAMEKLERLVWPYVKAQILARIQEVKDSSKESGKLPIIIVEAAVLLDAGWQHFLDGVWVVSVPKLEAIQRLRENRGLSIEDAEKRIAAQQSRRGIGNLEEEFRKKVVTAVIENRGSLDDLKKSLEEKLQDPNAWYHSTP